MSSQVDVLKSRYVEHVRSFLEAEESGENIDFARKALLSAASQYAATQSGLKGISDDIRIIRIKHPDSELTPILSKVVYRATLMGKSENMPENTYHARVEKAAKLQERVARLQHKAESTGDEEDKRNVREAAKQWKEAERELHALTPGDEFKVVSGRIAAHGTVGTLIRTHDGEYGIRLLLRESDGHEFWIAYSSVKHYP